MNLIVEKEGLTGGNGPLGPFLGKVDFAIQSILESHGSGGLLRHRVEMLKIVDTEVKEFVELATRDFQRRSNRDTDFLQMTGYINERISEYVEIRVPRNAELDVDDELIGLLTDCINEQATRYMQSELDMVADAMDEERRLASQESCNRVELPGASVAAFRTPVANAGW